MSVAYNTILNILHVINSLDELIDLKKRIDNQIIQIRSGLEIDEPEQGFEDLNESLASTTSEADSDEDEDEDPANIFAKEIPGEEDDDADFELANEDIDEVDGAIPASEKIFDAGPIGEPIPESQQTKVTTYSDVHLAPTYLSPTTKYIYAIVAKEPSELPASKGWKENRFLFKSILRVGQCVNLNHRMREHQTRDAPYRAALPATAKMLVFQVLEEANPFELEKKALCMESAAMRLRRHFSDQYSDKPGYRAARGFNAAVEVFVNCHAEEMVTKAANLLIKAFHGKTYYTCGQKFAKCPVPACPKYFRRLEDQNKHFAAVHTSKHAYVCDICLETFRWQKSLIYHRYGHKRIPCPGCNKTFWREDLAKECEASHLKEKKKCNLMKVDKKGKERICGALLNPANYSRHVKEAHEKIKKRCPYRDVDDPTKQCAYEAISGPLRRHILQYHDIHQLPCQYCGKTFKTTQAVGNHEDGCKANPSRLAKQ